MDKKQGRKTYQGEKNNKERTMGKLISSVGKVLEDKGYTGLTTANIAKVAGVDRKLISLYFGSLDNLVETYIKGKDYWKTAAFAAVSNFGESPSAGSKGFLESLLMHQMDEFEANTELQKAILWQISEPSSIMSEVAHEREKMNALFFAFADKELVDKNIDLRGVTSVLLAGIYYLLLHAKNSGSTFCEIDLSTAEGMQRIRVAVKDILGWAYSSEKSEG